MVWEKSSIKPLNREQKEQEIKIPTELLWFLEGNRKKNRELCKTAINGIEDKNDWRKKDEARSIIFKQFPVTITYVFYNQEKRDQLKQYIDSLEEEQRGAIPELNPPPGIPKELLWFIQGDNEKNRELCKSYIKDLEGEDWQKRKMADKEMTTFFPMSLRKFFHSSREREILKQYIHFLEEKEQEELETTGVPSEVLIFIKDSKNRGTLRDLIDTLDNHDQVRSEILARKKGKIKEDVHRKIKGALS